LGGNYFREGFSNGTWMDVHIHVNGLCVYVMCVMEYVEYEATY
jgi:hypothetical protein